MTPSSQSGRRALILLFALSASAVAQQIYKSVDADGNVSYSSAPPPGAAPGQAQTVKIDPGPTETERAAAEQRLQSSLGGSGRSGDAGAEQDAEAKATKKSVQNVERRSEQVERQRSSSRIQRPSGGMSQPARGRAAGQLPSSRTSR